MNIKSKIFGALLGMSVLIVLVGLLAVNRQRASVQTAAMKEAENVARILGLLLEDTIKLSANAQEIVSQLHRMQNRDIVLLDSHKLDLADAIPASIGETYSEDRGGEVTQTIRDGKVRTFVEISSDHPQGIKQIVVPVQNKSDQIIGAVILEYTPLYNELMTLTKTTMDEVISAATASIVIALLIAFFMGRSIVSPLQQLTEAAAGFAAGRADVKLPPRRTDEIGALAKAFDDMMQRRRQAEEQLRQAH